MSRPLTALELVARDGAKLVGALVSTVPMGEYPGGVAKVMELEPDPACPEIVFQVEHPTFGSVGVFDYEPVRLVAR